MKSIVFSLFAYTAIATAAQEFHIPPAIANGIARSEAGEGIGFGIKGVDETVFRDFIKANWKNVADHVESLPLATPDYGRYSSKDSAFNASVVNFSVACECLPPMEYLDFLDKLLSLYEEKRISFLPIDLTFTGRDRKYYFLAVNWEHPKVQSLCARALKLIPADKETADLINIIESISKGELADNYLPDEGVDLPPPETLPGIKLQRPFASLSRKYEQLTGKKIPRDPQFDPRPPRRDAGSAETVAATTQDQTIWTWLACVTVLFAVAFSIWKLRTRRSAHS